MVKEQWNGRRGFAARLPAKVRAEFKTMVEAVRARGRKLPGDRRF
jgi:hypothetical protein